MYNKRNSWEAKLVKEGVVYRGGFWTCYEDAVKAYANLSLVHYPDE